MNLDNTKGSDDTVRETKLTRHSIQHGGWEGQNIHLEYLSFQDPNPHTAALLTIGQGVVPRQKSFSRPHPCKWIQRGRPIGTQESLLYSMGAPHRHNDLLTQIQLQAGALILR